MNEIKEKATKKAETAKTEVQPDGCIIYADAGVRPVNPGFGGWGFHGYLYSSQEPKKSMGPANWALTAKGYCAKSLGEAEITPVKYLDAFGTIPYVSNNGAEVLAAANAMDHVSRYNLKTLTIKTDSKYVITGAEEYLTRWKLNNWVKSDGNPVANLDHWKHLDEKLTHLKTNGVLVNFEWVKGHNGDQGNETADKYATIAALTSGKGIAKQMTQIALADTYWKPEESSHPLLAHRRMYFVTNPDNIQAGEYYLGEHGKEDELLGKRMADGSYAYVQLDVPDPYISLLIKKQLQISDSIDNIILARLDALFNNKVKKDLMIFGEEMLVPEGNRASNYQNLVLAGGKSEGSVDGDPISTCINPPLIAIRAIESVNFLKGLFLAWKDKKLEGVFETDITPLFYTADKKSGMKLVADFTSAMSAMPVQGNIDATGENKTNFELIIGIDVPSRNTFKHMESLNPKITMLVWKDSDKAYRYATLIEAEGGKAIWCGYYSNYKYLF